MFPVEPHSPAAIPLLLTSSVVAHDIAVKLKDTEARLHHVLESIAQWLRIAPRQPIVLCDGSNFDFRPVVQEAHPHAQIESLFFENDQQKVREFGRGYGEGEIVKYAIQHSKLIQQAGCFAKCTSKLWVENFEACKKHWNGQLLFSGVFLNVFSPLQPTVLQQIDTRFYFASLSMYERYFMNAHLTMDSRAGHGLEDSFFDILVRENISHCLLPTPPVIAGVGGGTGAYYRNTLKRALKEKLRLYLVRHDRKFARLFSA